MIKKMKILIKKYNNNDINNNKDKKYDNLYNDNKNLKKMKMMII